MNWTYLGKLFVPEKPNGGHAFTFIWSSHSGLQSGTYCSHLNICSWSLCLGGALD